MKLQTLTFILAVSIQSSAAVLFATIGEIVAERGGILNLGVEGMMLMGALSGFATAYLTQSLVLGLLAAMAVSGLLAFIHGVFAITLRANQVVCGLSLAILGIGLSSFLGRPLIGKVAVRFPVWSVPFLSDLPVLGPALFSQVPLIYLGYILVPTAWWVLFYTRPGLNLRAVGENPAAANTAGIGVAATRYAWTVLGGMLAGLGGAYLSLAYTPGWRENMSAGQGWIAIAMVIFALWNPWRAALGAMLFGLVNAVQFTLEARQISLLPSYLLRMLPYLFTILILVLITRSKGVRKRSGAPASLGLPFAREG
jgi:general nucleoside transport system permease protein